MALPQRKFSALLWLLRAAALIGLGLSVLSLAGTLRGQAVGCTVGSGCATALTSRYSHVLGLPVSLAAIAVYVAVLAASIRPQRRQAWLTLCLTAGVLIGAAIWFGLVQAALLQAFCPLCTLTHVAGLVTATLALGLLRPAKRPVAAGAAVVGVLAIVQVLQPHAAPSVGAQQANITFQDTGPGPGRVLRFQVGDAAAQLQPAQLPHLGDMQQAPIVLIEFMDYTCDFCRATHAYLDGVKSAFGEDIAIALVGVPLSAPCNPRLDDAPPRHEASCDLQRLALAVWRIQPTLYPALHEHLMAATPDPLAAEAWVRQRLGDSADLDTALADPEVTAQLARNAELFARIGGSLPQLIIGPLHIRGLPPDPQTLIDDIASQTSLTPRQ